MAMDQGARSLPLLNGKSVQLESSTTTVSPISHQISSSPRGHSLQLDSSAIYVNPVSRHMPVPNGQLSWSGKSGLPVGPGSRNLSVNTQLLHAEPAVLSAGMDSHRMSMVNKPVQMEFSSYKFQNIEHNSIKPHQSLSAQRQLAKKKFVPQSSTIPNTSTHLFSKNNQATRREPWPKVISAMPVNTGSRKIPSSPKESGQLDQSQKVPKSTSVNGGLQKSSSINKRGTQPEPSPKASSESIESVRSKMRESLATSLALACEEKSNSELGVKDSPSLGRNARKEEELCSHGGDNSYMQMNDSLCISTGCHSDSLKLGELDSNKNDEFQNVLSVPSSNDLLVDSPQLHKSNEGDATCNDILLGKDELLQGNGLCWISGPATVMDEKKESHYSKRPRLSDVSESGDINALPQRSPQTLALLVEAELFKLFGGVNKKYKEKGRSLMFNLKDPNNPELRKQVLSGEIAPERLCSMTAEELASKELSEWRIAKAEEFALMVVLPDDDIDPRRLVKKTHKGEVQVEVERDDSASVEVGLVTSSLSGVSAELDTNRSQMPKSSKRKAHIISKSNENRPSEGGASKVQTDSADQTFADSLVDFPHEKTDFMEDIIMDEFKDDTSMQQVPSLDEFMKDLDSEPPFKNLAVDIDEDTNVSSEKTSGALELRSKSNAEFNGLESKLDSVEHLGPDAEPEKAEIKHDPASIRSLEHADTDAKDSIDAVTSNSSKIDILRKGPEGISKNAAIDMGSDTQTVSDSRSAEDSWVGAIQLNVSSLVTINGSYKSGEQTSTRDWPGLIEIKGRVKLDAFEKFLQQLPLSRSRAVMIFQFCWKEGSSEAGRINLSETIDSYITDGRVGYAVPTPSVEIYFCPPHTKITEILLKQLPKEHEETLMTCSDGFIGVVLWRRSQSDSTISTKSSSQHKHKSKKRHNSKTNFASTGSVSICKNKPSEDDLTDDAPPGFGPTRDDDLPEFDFSRNNSQSVTNSSNPHSRTSARPAEQMRHLINKYGCDEGRNSSRVRDDSWKDDDDDDIPEWQPNRDSYSHQQPPVPPQAFVYQQQAMQPQLPTQNLPPPTQPSTFHTSNIQHQLVPLAAPMSVSPQPHQTQIGLVQGVQNVHPGWQQPGQWWAPAQVPVNVGFPANGMVQPYNYSSQAMGMPSVVEYNIQENVERRNNVHMM